MQISKKYFTTNTFLRCSFDEIKGDFNCKNDSKFTSGKNKSKICERPIVLLIELFLLVILVYSKTIQNLHFKQIKPRQLPR